MDVEDARTIGRWLRQIRKARGKSLVVIAGLAGMSKSQLDRIERGEVALDKLSEIVALANALQIAPSDLMRLPVPAPANGHTDSTVEAVGLALMAVSHDLPDGQVLAVEVLRARVTATVDALCRCEREREVGAALPGLIRDLHASVAAGRDGRLVDDPRPGRTRGDAPGRGHDRAVRVDPGVCPVSAPLRDPRGQLVVGSRPVSVRWGLSVLDWHRHAIDDLGRQPNRCPKAPPDRHSKPNASVARKG